MQCNTGGGGGDGGVSLLVINDPKTGVVGGKTLSELLRGVKTGIDGLTLTGATITLSTIKLNTRCVVIVVFLVVVFISSGIYYPLNCIMIDDAY